MKYILDIIIIILLLLLIAIDTHRPITVPVDNQTIEVDDSD